MSIGSDTWARHKPSEARTSGSEPIVYAMTIGEGTHRFISM